ncbi:pancreatic triacylglycerol lipase-like [Helicoverpa zea]|uniref:pancreatic triacylglycerol lipase-like n=1 Tax=Helicoverpa zea TaxID=7113 RepID=UPI001F5A06A2|nr:pancreatic triacylglycerol lipase-like [Helicoverpa zea]
MCSAKTLLYLTPLFLIGSLELTQAASIICYNGSLTNYKETPLEEPLAILPGLAKDLKTVFYTFGYRGKVKGPATTAMIQAYVAKNKSNICLLNWEGEAESTLLGTRIGYLYAVNNAVKIGNQLGDALVTLIKAGLNVVDLQLIAHSLGAHLMGYAGRRARKLGYIIPRVTGLDPAGVFFEGFTIYQALDRRSGLFVDVIHTDAGGYGMRKSDVTVEFWPNTDEKESQPGCPVGDFEMFTKESLCSHDRAWQYYSESLAYPTALQAVYANSFEEWNTNGGNTNQTIYMGDLTNTQAKGSYYLRTSNSSRFGLYEAGIKSS